ncbi:glycerophosphodiester phosphodiesterase [Leifsonia sp. 22587]|uniref:glycerophosphodiester phosphodiesterase n=1 Tax=Leifsonia sp. 22587 TaxID=3453946 RepID=UPI003F843683
MPDPDDLTPSSETRRVSRRALIGGIAGGLVGAAVVVGGGAVLLPGLLGGQTKSAPTASPTPTPSSAGDGLLADRLLARPGFTVAHRGGSLDWPEMSMEAYRNSVALGVNALEISLARTSDGVWFGLHDATLDRTSGTSGFFAADHTWAEVQRYRITAAETTDPGQPAQPYLRFDDLVDAYADTHTIFVDPKVAPTEHLGELFALMAKARHPTRTFVAKGYCTTTAWPLDAQSRGFRTWGYYYGSELAADPSLLPSTQAQWTWLGLDYEADANTWRSMTAGDKPVLAHIVPSRADAELSLQRGAAGLVVSGVREVLASGPVR